ncbi:transglycosylase SLT domain-containing protein, partial [Clostridium sp.]|uniref:transglycosylase SLT domain-containing protein n=1 Tax=Clostridium sp. TaxID=1506 RepID=UPI002588C99B
NPINNQLNDTNATLSNFSKSSIAYGQQMNSSVGNGIQTTDINVYNPLDNMVNNVKTTLQNFATSSIQYGKDTVTQIGQGIQASQDNLTGIVTTLTNKVVDSFKQGFGIHSPSTVMYSIGNYLMQGLVNGMSASDVTAFVTKQIGSATSAATGAVGGNITNWLTVAMGITGTPITFLPMLQSIAMHEFGGDPHSINLWDSNAAAGHPSKGLMQMIDETFNSYKMPGLNDIWNPIDNAVSSIRYMEGRYGSIANVPGVRNMVGGGGYVGYANGTNNATAGLHWIGENGPELMRFRGGEQVIPSRESQQILQNSYGGNTNVVIQSSPTFQINIDGSDKDAKSIAAEVERILRTRFGEFFDGEMKSILRQLGMA